MLNSFPRDIAGGSLPDPDPRDVDFGLVIGVDHYPRFRSLRGAVTDATRFHDWLCEDRGGGLAPERAWLVQSRPDPIAPMQDEVDDKLLELVTAADAIGGGRRLYFHFSGHGAGSPGESDDVALLLAKWSQSLARLALSTDKYRGALGELGLFEEIVVSLDCCRTTAERAIGLPPTITFQPQTGRCPTRMFIAYATEPDRSAFEVADHELWQGVFTRCLLAILRSSPRGITAADLKRALEYEVALHGQRAHVVNGLPDDSRFGRERIAPNLVITFEQARDRVRLRDGRRLVVAEREVAPAADTGHPWELSIEAGLYKLEDSAGKAVMFDHGGEAVTRVVF
jgi:hypothetical protein